MTTNSSEAQSYQEFNKIATSDITWPEIDGLHDPGYYKLSLKSEKSPIPCMVSYIQHEEANSRRDHDGDDPDPGATAGSEYIDEIVELKLQLANRRAEIDELKASLTRCMSDKEVLVAETSALVDELDQCRQSGLNPESIRSPGLDGFSSSILSIGRRKSDQRKNGSIQMLLDPTLNFSCRIHNSRLKIMHSVNHCRQCFWETGNLKKIKAPPIT